MPQNILSAFFSDETERFRMPPEPDPGQNVKIRIRTPNNADFSVLLLTSELPYALTMKESPEAAADGRFTYYEAEFTCSDEQVSYCFVIRIGGRTYHYRKDGLKPAGEDDSSASASRMNFRFTPGYRTPEWSRGALQYQIMVDRFCNGDPSNDVLDNEYSYIRAHVKQASSWSDLPVTGDYRHFYGGDLRGVIDKLDYIQSLGVEAIYFNPIFLSPSSHKYDTQDYDHIDPHFGVISEDSGDVLPDGVNDNTKATRFISRVISAENLQKSDELFAELCREMHSRGMKIILDGVFNHCGSFHKWLDREGIYRQNGRFAPGAFQSTFSPFRNYFQFDGMDSFDYEGWHGHYTLPKLNYEFASDLRDRIIETACKWASPPYSIDGWRLDVAADLGHSPEYNHIFWRRFRKKLKEVNPDILIIAEHYGDPSSWLQGGQWDSVMNYDAFMEPVGYFLTGMEKHSEGSSAHLYQNGEAFFSAMQKNMATFQHSSLLSAMNELSNHDHSRFLTRTNRSEGRLHSRGSAAAEDGIDKSVFREAVVIQMTWPGAPTIYYGDEAGVCGWTDPDNRRTYPWGHEDQELLEFHRAVAAMRKRHPSLRTGSLLPLGCGTGWIAYARFDGEEAVVTAVNNGGESKKIELPVWQAGAPDEAVFNTEFISDKDGYTADCGEENAVTAEGGVLALTLAPHSAVVLSSS